MTKTRLTILEINEYFDDILDGIFFEKYITNKLKRFVIQSLIDGVTSIDFSNFLFRKQKSFYDTRLYKDQTDHFDGTVLKDEYFDTIQKRFEERFEVYNKNKDNTGIQLDEDDEIDGLEKSEQVKIGQRSYMVYKVDRNATIHSFYDSLSKEKGLSRFTYDWDNPDIKNGVIMNEKTSLQRTKVIILSKKMEYMLRVNYHYYCIDCGHETIYPINEVISNNFRGLCKGTKITASGKVSDCKRSLINPTDKSDMVEIHSYEAITFDEEGRVKAIRIDSLEKLENSQYEIVGVRTADEDDFVFFSFSAKKIQARKVDFSSIIVKDEEPRDDNDTHNMLYDVIDFIDDIIEESVNERIQGMLDFKLCMLLQKYMHHFGSSNNNHLMFVGFPGIGKSMTINYYGEVLYHGRFKSTEGKSISSASLRGSIYGINQKTKGRVMSFGLFSLFDCIYIDEAKENPDLLDFLKTNLVKDTYSNDTAGADGASKPRVAQVCVAENPRQEHMKEYMRNVRKTYEEVQNQKSQGTDVSQDIIPFNPSWDLFQPLPFYDFNKDLRKAIRIVRREYMEEQTLWLNGRERATVDRYPMLYHVDKREGNIIRRKEEKIVKNHNKRGHDNFSAYTRLMIDNIDEFFETFYENYSFDSLIEKKILTEQEVITILRPMYDFIDENIIYFDGGTRLRNFMYLFADFCRIMNKRYRFNDIDYGMVSRFLIMHNRMNYVHEMDSFEFDSVESLNLLKTRIAKEIHDKDKEDDEEQTDNTDSTDLFDSVDDI